MINNFDKLCVVDLECTCWEGGIAPVGQQAEIIQVGWAWLDIGTLDVSGKGMVMVRPSRSHVGEYCTALTGITPKMVKGGAPFANVCKTLIRKLGCRNRAWAAWGGDKRMLDEHVAFFGAEQHPFPDDGFLNIQMLFALVEREQSARPSLEKAMRRKGVSPSGDAHRADNDAMAAAGVLSKVLAKARLGIF